MSNYIVKPVLSFERELRKLNPQHKSRIRKLIEKVEKEGLHSLRILSMQGNYILGEVKSRRPPYRLYVIYDQKTKIFFVVKWAHKNEQQRTINTLQRKLQEALDLGIEELFSFI